MYSGCRSVEHTSVSPDCWKLCFLDTPIAGNTRVAQGDCGHHKTDGGWDGGVRIERPRARHGDHRRVQPVLSLCGWAGRRRSDSPVCCHRHRRAGDTACSTACEQVRSLISEASGLTGLWYRMRSNECELSLPREVSCSVACYQQGPRL